MCTSVFVFVCVCLSERWLQLWTCRSCTHEIRISITCVIVWSTCQLLNHPIAIKKIYWHIKANKRLHLVSHFPSMESNCASVGLKKSDSLIAELCECSMYKGFSADASLFASNLWNSLDVLSRIAKAHIAPTPLALPPLILHEHFTSFVWGSK